MRSRGCTAKDRLSKRTRAPNSTRNDWIETKERELARGDPSVKRHSNGKRFAFLLSSAITFLLPCLEEEFDLTKQAIAVMIPCFSATKNCL